MHEPAGELALFPDHAFKRGEKMGNLEGRNLAEL